MTGVWDYGSVDDIQPLEDSSDEEQRDHGTYDELSLLPASKRRKLQQLNRSRKKVELIDLDNEKDEDDDASQGLYTVGKPNVNKAAGAESDSDLDLEYRPSVKRQSIISTPVDPIVAQNQALLRSFKQAAQEPAIDESSPGCVVCVCVVVFLLPSTAAAAFVSRQERLAPIIPRRPTAQPEPQSATDSDDDAASDTDAPAPEPEDDKIVLSMQSKEGKLNLRIGRQTALSKLFDSYKQQAIKKGWLQAAKATSVRFLWDDDKLSGTETAEGIDCDNNDIIEVRW